MIKSILFTKARAIVTTIVQVIVLLLITKFAAADVYGKLASLQSIAILTSIIASLGLGQSSVFHVGRNEMPVSVQRIGLVKIGLVLCVLVSSSSTVLFFKLFGSLILEIGWHIVFSIICLQCMLSFLLLMLQSINNINRINIANIVMILPYAILISIHSYKATLTLDAVVCSLLVGLMCAVIYASYSWFTVVSVSSGLTDVPLGKFLGYGVNSFFNNFLSMWLYRFPIILGARFIEPAVLSQLSLAIVMAEKIWVSANSIALVYFPRAIREIISDNTLILYRKCQVLNFLTSTLFTVAILILLYATIHFKFLSQASVDFHLFAICLVGAFMWGVIKLQGALSASMRLQSKVAVILIAASSLVLSMLIFIKPNAIDLAILYASIPFAIAIVLEAVNRRYVLMITLRGN